MDIKRQEEGHLDRRMYKRWQYHLIIRRKLDSSLRRGYGGWPYFLITPQTKFASLGVFGSAVTSLHLVRLRNQGLLMPNVDANGKYVRSQFIACSDEEKIPSDEETGSQAETMENRA